MVVLTIAMWDIVLGIAMYGYLWLLWNTKKSIIQRRGWKLEYADPTMLRDAYHFFIPLVGIWFYLIIGTTLEEMSVTNKRESGGVINVTILGFRSTYAEPIE